MFNMIVKWGKWDDRRDTIPASRMFGSTDDKIKSNFRDGRTIDFAALSELPTLFIEETTKHNDPIVKLGTLEEARIISKDIHMKYRFHNDVPNFRNSQLIAMGADFGLGRFSLTTTHWAVKGNNLYKILFEGLNTSRQLPTVFEIADPADLDPKQVSAMMPFSAAFDEVYTAIELAADELGMRCNRADNIWENHAVIQDVVSLIDRSQIVICDCSGRNPNVFYEIGIAHTLGREVILITQSGDDIPFDLQHIRHIRYDNNADGRASLVRQLSDRMKTLA